MRRILILFLLILIGKPAICDPISGYAEKQGLTIKPNRVVDSSNGSPISSAKINIPSKNYSTTTDENGNFRLQADINAPTIMSVEKDGYKPFSLTMDKLATAKPIVIGIEKSNPADIIIKQDLLHLGDNNFSTNSANANDFQADAKTPYFSKKFKITAPKINEEASYRITRTRDGKMFNTYSELENATTFYGGGTERIPTRNDYTYVLEDETHNGVTTKYTFQGGTYPAGRWEFDVEISEAEIAELLSDEEDIYNYTAEYDVNHNCIVRIPMSFIFPYNPNYEITEFDDDSFTCNFYYNDDSIDGERVILQNTCQMTVSIDWNENYPLGFIITDIDVNDI